jgi:hypothetical protein
MWRDDFGPTATIQVVDVNPHCRECTSERFTLPVADRADRGFLRHLRQQIHTFDDLFPHRSSRGIDLCEDLHTSYWKKYGGGTRRRGTFIEYAKPMIEFLSAWHSCQPRHLSVSGFTRIVDSLHFYDSILVIEMGPHPKPALLHTVHPVIPVLIPPRSGFWRWILPRRSSWPPRNAFLGDPQKQHGHGAMRLTGPCLVQGIDSFTQTRLMD